MATVSGKTTVGVALTVIPGSGSGTNQDWVRELLQAIPDHDWTFGTGNYQINKWYEAINVPHAATVGTTNIELDNLTGVGGEAVVFTKIKLLWMYNTSTTSGDDLAIGGDFITTNYAGTGFQLYPDSCLFLPIPIAGLTVTGGASDTISIANDNSGTISVQVFIAGN